MRLLLAFLCVRVVLFTLRHYYIKASIFVSDPSQLIFAMASCVASAAEVAAMVDAVDYVLLDIDGVVWSGEGVLPRIPETLQHFRSIGKQIRFISKNLIYSRDAIAAQFTQKGIAGVTRDEIYTVAYAAALYLRERFAADASDGLVRGNVFVVGGPGLHEEIRAVLAPGYTTYGAELRDVRYVPDTIAEAWQTPLLPPPEDPQAAEHLRGRLVSLEEMHFVAVAVGLDFELNMAKLGCAAAVLQSSPAVFVGTNPDPSDPAGAQHVLLPASGAVLAAMTTALDRSPDVMCGKPSPTLGHLLLEKEAKDGHTVDQQRCLMVGDRLMTDIQFGKGMGARTALVLSGAQKLADVVELEKQGAREELPDFVLDSLADVLSANEAA